ncbi:MAG TPA: hypothetical protein VF491_15855 [Vicinamibacterales bacterium]
MDEFTRVWDNLVGRLTGPMTFRLFLQPIMATLFAIRDGRKDAAQGRPAYLWALLSRPGERMRLLSDGWKGFGRVFVFAIIIDGVYEWQVFHRFYPLESLLVAMMLAALPYALLRGPVNRVLRRRH